MPPADRLDRATRELAVLAATDEDAAIALALHLVGTERVHRALEPALALLTRVGPRLEARAARGPLRERYQDLHEHGNRADQDCDLRTGIMRVLRGLGHPGDRDLAEIGLATVQLRMGVDVAQALRAESLLLLGEIQPERADFRAVELLDDPHTSTFSGEPAATAARYLSTRGHVLPMWAVVRRSDVPADVLAQAFAAVRASAPADLQLGVLRGHLSSENDALLLVAAEAIVLNELRDGYDDVRALARRDLHPSLHQYLEALLIRIGDSPTSAPGAKRRVASASQRSHQSGLPGTSTSI